MALTFGFYNSLNNDRRYDALQMSSLFDGVIGDGVFSTIGTALRVTPAGGMTVAVGEGRAWFNHTWTNNDSELVLSIDEADLVLGRVDSIVLEVDSSEDVRANSIKVVTGLPDQNPYPFQPIHTETKHQYVLALVTVPAELAEITDANISNMVGLSNCPFVIGAVTTLGIDGIVSRWEREFDNWFNNIQEQLGEDPAGNLQNQIDEDRKKISNIPATNYLANPYFSVDQRNSPGDSLSGPDYVTAADRWACRRTEGDSSWFVQRSPLRVPSVGVFFNALDIASFRDGTDAVTQVSLYQNMESYDSMGLRGLPIVFSVCVENQDVVPGTRTITLSVVAADARSGEAGNETELDQSIISGYTNPETLGTETYDITEISGQFTASLIIPQVPEYITQMYVCLAVNFGEVDPGVQQELLVHGCKLEVGTSFTGWNALDQHANLMRCMRYYEKSYRQQVPPGSPSIAGAVSKTYPYLYGTGGAQYNPIYDTVSFKVHKRAIPEFKVYDVQGAVNHCTQYGTSREVTVNNLRVTEDSAELLLMPDPNAWPVLQYNWTADADFF